MKKRGAGIIYLVLISILLILSFSGFISAEQCTGSSTPTCSVITSEYVCNQYSSACTWSYGSCVNRGLQCYQVNVPSCSYIGCSGGCVCSSGACCDGCNYRTSSVICETISSYYTCSSGRIYIQSHVRYCSGSSASCSGSTGTTNTLYQTCPNSVCDQDNFYPPPLCACAGTTSTTPNEYCTCQTGPGAPSCCDSQDHWGCYNNDVYWYDSCNSRQNLYRDCTSTEACNAATGQCANLHSKRSILHYRKCMLFWLLCRRNMRIKLRL